MVKEGLLGIYDSTDVYKPQQEPGGLEKPVYTDVRGSIHRVEVEGIKVNILFTKAGFMRSGDLHKNRQLDVILSGEIELWLRKGDEDVKKRVGPNELIDIPPHTPHLFNFLEDTVMIEWWEGPFEAWYYRPYREAIDRQFKKMTKGSKNA